MFKFLKFGNNPASEGIPLELPFTLISEKITISVDKLTGGDSVRVDGTLSGDVNITNSFTLGESGHVYGDIKCTNAIIAGRVKGNIICSGVIHILPTGIVKGNISAENAQINAGAVINGFCTIGDENNTDFKFTPVKKIKESSAKQYAEEKI